MSRAFMGAKGLFRSKRLMNVSPSSPSSLISKQPLLGFSGFSTTFTPPSRPFSNPSFTSKALVLNELHCLQCSTIIVFLELSTSTLISNAFCSGWLILAFFFLGVSGMMGFACLVALRVTLVEGSTTVLFLGAIDFWLKKSRRKIQGHSIEDEETNFLIFFFNLRSKKKFYDYLMTKLLTWSLIFQ